MRSTTMKIATAAVLAAIALAACSSSSKSGSSTTSPPTEAPTTAAPASSGSTGGTGAAGTYTVALATTTVKGSTQKVLVDSQGRVLYVDENDKPGKPACIGACLKIWPPLKATGAITVAPGLTAKYTTVTASDGTKQVAVNGSPLYLFAGKPAGDASGQDVGGFYVVMASGTKYDPGAATGATGS